MLLRAMRVFVTAAALAVITAAVVWVWRATFLPTPADSVRIASVLRDPAPPAEPASYAHCASCHLHDGSGRPDGSIPRLNGQLQAVLEHKLRRLRAGMIRIPVMDPFARTLAPGEVSEVAAYLAGLPDTSIAPRRDPEAVEEGAALYASHCASCHGDHGEGDEGFLASRLCGQYAGYLERRLLEVQSGARAGADAVMRGVLEGVPQSALEPIVSWLAHGGGCKQP